MAEPGGIGPAGGPAGGAAGRAAESPLGGQTITQMGYVVPDLAAAIAQWTEILDVGPFTVLPRIVIDQARYRGAPTDVEIKVATAEAGNVQIELIEQTNPVPSCYRDLFEAGSGGLHHVAVHTTEYDAEVARFQALGFPTAFCGIYQGIRFAYMDTSPSLGIMVEVVENPGGSRGSERGGA